MAHNARIRVSGQWIAVTAIDPNELETFDLRQFQAINGDLGGTWAPSAVIIIGGLGLQVDGPSTLNDCVGFTMDTGVLSITGTGVLDMDSGTTAQLAGIVNFRDAVNFKGTSTTNVESAATINFQDGSQANFEDNSTAEFQSGSAISMLSGSGFATASGAVVAFGSEAGFLNKINRIGATARVTQSGRKVQITADTLAGVEYDFIEVNNTTASPITLTLKRSTAPVPVAAEPITIQRTGSGSGGVTVKNEGDAANVLLFPTNIRGICTVVFDGVRWRLASYYADGVVTPGAEAAAP